MYFSFLNKHKVPTHIWVQEVGRYTVGGKYTVWLHSSLLRPFDRGHVHVMCADVGLSFSGNAPCRKHRWGLQSLAAIAILNSGVEL